MSPNRIYLTGNVRALGIHFVAARGTGKSRALGRIFLPQDACAGVPTIVIDPIGETINNFISKIAELPQDIQQDIWPRVVYIDMAGRNGFVTPFPLYYRLHIESYYQVAQRFLEVVKWSDPKLVDAPVRGWGPAWRLGSHAGTILYAAGYQISEMEHLLTQTKSWEPLFQTLEHTIPEVKNAIAFMRTYADNSREYKATQSDALRIKTNVFTIDPDTLAMFGAKTPMVRIDEVIKKKQIVLIDVGGVADIERRRFMLMWLISYVTTYIKARGPGHDKPPLSLVIDEFSLLTGSQSESHVSFSEELDQLVNVYSRSHRLWLTVAGQSIAQYNEATQRALLSLGTQIFGAVPDMASAKHIAESFATLDPTKRKLETLYSQTFQPLQEQVHVIAQRLRGLARFTFLMRLALEEGTVADTFQQVSLREVDKDMWVKPEVVEKVKTILQKRSALPVGPILADIASRIPQSIPSHSDTSSRENKRPNQKSGTLPPEDPNLVDF